MYKLPSILLVGCGHIGRAMLNGWLNQKLAPSVIVHRYPLTLPHPHIQVEAINDIPLKFQPDIILLATKPQQAKENISLIKPWIKNSIVISILGGKTLSWLQKQLPPTTSLIRAVPNIASELTLGMTIAVANNFVQPSQKQTVTHLFEAIGKIIWLDSEEKIDLATAISGCGPAYIFLLTELLQNISTQKGLPENLAKILACQTVIGSAALLAHSTEEAETLRKTVTTPQGITEKAIEILNDPHEWPDSLARALQAAINRSKEMIS